MYATETKPQNQLTLLYRQKGCQCMLHEIVIHPARWYDQSRLRWSCQVDSILVAASQRLYLLNQLRYMSLDIVGLSNVFRSLVVSKMLYALPAISGSLNQSDITRLDTLLRKAKRWGLTDMTETFGDLSDNADERLFRSLQFNSEHCLTQLLPALNRKDRYNLRHKTKYDIPLIKKWKTLKFFHF